MVQRIKMCLDVKVKQKTPVESMWENRWEKKPFEHMESGYDKLRQHIKK